MLILFLLISMFSLNSQEGKQNETVVLGLQRKKDVKLTHPFRKHLSSAY